MSQLENVITTTFRARGNQAIAQMGSVAQGFGSIGRQINENTRLSERLNSQWRALGTTIRYSIAGTAVFGLTRLVGQLKDVQQQLGLMQAIGEPVGGGVFSNQQITDLGNRLRQSAMDALTPVSDINDAVINFLSTVQGVKQSEIPEIVTNIGQAAKLAQTPVEDLTKAATTMNIAFGRTNNFRNISEFNRMWFALIKTAPGGIAAAPQIAQQIPALATMFMLAPGQKTSPREAQAQLMSLTLGSVRTGAPPSVAMRGLTYLLQSVAQPTGGAGKALAGIGITPQFVQQRGIYAAVLRLLHTITNTGNAKLIAQIPDDQLDDTSNLPGIPANEMIRLRQMVPRIHGIRAAIILAHQLRAQGNVGSLQDDLNMMQQEQNNMVSDSLNMAKAWQNFRRRSQLQAATTAINTMSLQVAQMFEPVLNFVARGPIALQGAMQRHQHASRIAAYGITGAISGAMVARLLFGGSRLSKIPVLGRLLGGGAGNAFVQARAAEAAISGNTVLGGTPQNPMYVVIVGQLFNSGGGFRSGTNTGGGGLGGEVAAGAEGAAGGAGGFSLFRFGRSALRGAGRLSGAAMRKALGVADAGAVRASTFMGDEAALSRFLKLGGRWGGLPLAALTELAFPDSTAKERDKFTVQRARHLFGPSITGGGKITGLERPAIGTMNGKAEVWLTLDINNGGKITRRRVHVPLNMWAHGRFPSVGGQPGSQRTH